MVYLHTNKINDKKYVGITSRNPEDRWGNNGYNYNDSPRFWNAIQKYGWDSFKHEILYTGLTKEDACNKEIELIASYQTTNPDFGYNLHSGGGMPPIMIGESNPFYGDHRFAGENHPMYGRKHSEETKRKMSQNHRDVKRENNPFYGDHRFAGKNHPNAKAVVCVETGIVYDTVSEAEKQTGVARSNIAKQIKGLIKHAGGYHWKYLTDSLAVS